MDKMRLVGQGFTPNRSLGARDASHRHMSGVRVSVIPQPFISRALASYNAWIVLTFATTHLSMVSALGNFSVESTSYNCSSNVICLGTTHVYAGNESTGIQGGRLSLIQEGGFGKAGIAYYQEPVRLFDRSTGQSASFNTSFTVDKVNRYYNGSIEIGDGMTFVISADNTTIGQAGEWFGLFDSLGMTPLKSIIVEFDTWYNIDSLVHDISGNHVSFDFANISYAAAANASDVNVDLWDDLTIYVWIEYDSQTQQLEVRVRNANYRPVKPLLRHEVKLSDVVEEYMWVGFSSSAGQASANFYIWDWTFDSYGIQDAATSLPTGGPTPGPTGSKSSRSHLGLIVGIAVGIPSILLVSIVIALFAYRRWSGGRRYQLGSRSNTRESITMQIEGAPEIFSYKQLRVATNAFSEESKLGQGGFGSVYRGVLPYSGIPVAVKKIKSDSSQGKKEFMAEVSIISQLRHRNLIQLIGWCKDVSRGKYLLVYELMPNGSLDKALFDSACNPSVCLSWEQRFNIVTGTAAALDYLHQGWKLKRKVIHRDIKSSNIMLDGDWNAKLGDFGLARLVDHQRAPDTTLVAGTYGYMAPEIAASGKFTDKTDVFAFGAVVLEVACGRRALAPDLPEDEVILVDWIWQKVSEGGLMSTVDKRLENYDTEWMEVLLIIGLKCSHPNPLERPSMGQVVQVLAGNVPVPSIPLSKPAFVIGSDRQNVLLEYIHGSKPATSRSISNGSKSGTISTSRSIYRSMSLTSRNNSNAPRGLTQHD